MAKVARKDAGETTDAYCPHCFLLVEEKVQGEWPDVPTRCPHCRLMIGVGRARPTPAANPGARGTAAGVFAHQAKRRDDSDVSPDEVRAAIRAVAEQLGTRPEGSGGGLDMTVAPSAHAELLYGSAPDADLLRRYHEDGDVRARQALIE